MPAFEVTDLRKVYKSPPVVANDGVSFRMEPGEAFGLLGPNGAGKTTLVRQLVGLLRPSGGEMRLFGERVTPSPSLRRRVGRTVAYLPQGALAQGEWKVREAVVWTAALRGCERRSAEDETADLLARLEITELADRQLRTLSGGQRRLTQIAMTLVGHLPVLILDEPTADIDPSLRRTVWSLLSERARAGAAVLLVTHDVAEAEHVLDRVAIMKQGRVLATGTPQELKARLVQGMRVEVVLRDDAHASAAEVLPVFGPRATADGRTIKLWAEPDEAVRVLDKLLATAGDELEDVKLVTPTLEDVYMNVAGASFAEEETSG